MTPARRGLGRPSDHYDGRKFFNPRIDTDKSLRDLRRWRQSRRPGAWPSRLRNPIFPPPPEVARDEISLTFIGHATFLLRFDGMNLLTDPIFSERASPVSWSGPKRVRAPGVAFDNLPEIHFVLISHNHYDHMDLPSLRRLRDRWNPKIVTGLENGRYLARKGLGNCLELDWWEGCEPRPGMRITYVPAQHWSKRGLFDRRRMLWGGHVIDAPAGRVYFAGDTGYPGDFAAIRRRLGPPDIALLPIGAYEPRWFMGPQHMNPDEAVRAHLELEAALSLAMHFATFPLADEAMEAPLAALATARRRHGVPPQDFRVAGFGESVLWRKPRPAAG